MKFRHVSIRLTARFRAVLYLLRTFVVKEAKLRFAGERRVHRTQQPVKVEVVTVVTPTP